MNDFQYGHCPLCGKPLDKEGICTKKTCKRRKLQLKLKALQDKIKKTEEEHKDE